MKQKKNMILLLFIIIRGPPLLPLGMTATA